MARVVLEPAEREVLDGLLALTFKPPEGASGKASAVAAEVALEVGREFVEVTVLLLELKRVGLVEDCDCCEPQRWNVTSTGLAL